MNIKKYFTWNAINKKEIIRYGTTGMFVGGTDFGLYYILLHNFSPSLSKGISFTCSAVVAYLFHKYWTFEQLKASRREIIKFVMVNILMLEINVLVNQGMLSLWPKSVLLALFTAAMVTNLLTFIFFKFWVFRRLVERII